MQVEDCCQALLTQILPTIDEQREGICIDIGVGTFAFYCEIFAKLGFKTIAVEPLPINILKQLCSRYGVTLIEACVSEVSGIQTMHIGTFQGSQNLNLSSLESDWWGSSAKTAEVQSITLSQVLSSVDTRKVSCIKIDVEGAESRIIRQFISLSKSLLPNVVMFEYGGGDSKGRGQKGWSKKFISGTYECLEILKDCGYNSLIIIDSAKEAQEIILNLQSSNLDIYEIFPEVSIYGNIIAVRGIVSEKLKIDNILEICAKYKDETINSVDSKKSLEKTQKIDNQNLTKKHLENFQVTGEKLIIDRLIQSKQTVFDVGANIGSWTQAVLSSHSDIKIHLFEPVPQIYQSLLKNIFHRLETGKIFPNNLAIGRVEKLDKFYFYQETPTWSTLFRRFEVEKQYNIQPPQSFSVLVTSLDLYCQRWGINRINFLKIDVEGAELDVLQGCENLLQKAYIDYIQFEYGGTFLDAKITLKEVFDYLQKKRYSLFKITSKGFEYKPIFYPEYENYEYSNFLAINERFISNILGENPKMLDIKNLCQKYSIKPGGVIHIGAYEGKEVAEYQSMGVEKILFIEANPVVFERLQTNVEEYPNVTAVNCAINNIDGTVTMYLTSLDRRSSILPLKRIKEHYTNIKETNTIKVKSRRLDTLLQELELNPSEFNIINIDIQGAELLALEGATNLLQYIDAINTEVNYEELYEGCALIEEIDDFLQKKGLEKVATTTPDHPSWGDAFYVRKPVITMSTLGKNGRFANQLFQYAFLKIYAQEHNLRVETPAWIGQALFGSNDSPISRQLPVIQETSNDLALAKVPHSSQPFKNVDFWGYFQYNTKFYAPHKEYFRALFKPVAQIENRIQKAINRLHLKGKTIIGIHLHRGDYGYGYFFIAPCEWYKEWLKGLWGTLEEPVLFIASDELETVIDDFAEYNPVTSQQLGLDFPQAQFYPDFYILSQCDIVGISNSSFSFAACMLNEKGKLFFRPHLSSKKLIPFDPWNSETIFRDGKVEADKIMIKEDKSTEVNILEKEKLNNVSTKVLISFLATKNMYRETIISSQEVFCGPDCETTFEGQNYLTINTPLGEYDIGEIIQQLPQSQQPELLIVKADSTKGNFPVNLPRLKCPKLLICGNTQHLNSPLNTLVEYAKKEKFDFIMSDHKRHHLHYFKEAGFEKVFWVPGFNINPHPQQRNLTSKYPLTFVGQIGQFHPYRKSILAYLKELNFPLYKLKAPQKKAAEIYAESLINLNVSLNGDLNLRVFEVLSSGGFLLTDKLSQQSGLELLFEDHKHLVLFRNKSELREKINFFLENPEIAREIASNGCENFWQNHSPELNIKRVIDYINGKDIEPIYKIEAEKRSVYVHSNNLERLHQRISIYEFIQEIHLNLNKSDIKVLFLSQVDSRIICDVIDLPRLDVNIICDDYKKGNDNISTNLFYQCQVEKQITFIESWQLHNQTKLWDLIVLTEQELERIGVNKLLNLINFKNLIILEGEVNTNGKLGDKFDSLFARFGLVKESNEPLVYSWKNKSEWGTFLLAQKKNVLAIRAFEQALQDNPYDIKALVELGLLYAKLDDLTEAEKLLDKAVSLERRNPIAMKNLAKVLMGLNKYEAAANILEYLVEIKSEEIELWSWLEKCYLQQGLEQKALNIYHRCNYLRQGKSVDKDRESLTESNPKRTPKKILVINNLYPPQELGGYGRSISDFANVLEQRGNIIKVLTSDAPYLTQITTSEPNINRNLRLFGTFEGGAKAIEDSQEIQRIIVHNNQIIREIINEFAPDVCLVGNINFLGPEIFKPFLENYIPVINHLGFGTLLCSAREMPQKTFFSLATASEYVRQQIINQGYPIEDTIVVYPGAMVKQFKMCVLPNIEKLKIVYAGLIVPFKGPHILIEALKIIDDQNVDFECSLAGDNLDKEYLNTLQEYIIKHGMNDKVKFLGYLPREKLINLFSQKNILVFPSIWEEPFGISQVEGMAAGLTLITSATGGASEIAEADISGLTIPPNNSQVLAESLISLTKDRIRWKNIAVAGQERAINVFDINRSVDILEEKFDELLQQCQSNPKYLQDIILPELKTRLNLRNINLIIFPNWSQPEEVIMPELEVAIASFLTHPRNSQMTLLIDTTDISEEEANLALSGIVMNLMMEGDLEISEESEIFLLGQMKEIEWTVLLPCLHGRIILTNENLEALTRVKADTIQEWGSGGVGE